MMRKLSLVAALCTGLLAAPSWSQVPVTPTQDHDAQLASDDPRLRANKRLVYDFWREIFEAGQLDRVDRYMAEGYVQHNPNVPTGRAAFVAFFSQFVKPAPVELRIKAPLVSITAERDLVTLGFVRQYPDPKDPARTYTTTWFDMFRVENGRIVEHWDPDMKR